MTTLRQIVAATLEETMGRPMAVVMGDEVASALERNLRAAGFAVHNIADGKCIRINEEMPGRQMTRSEVELIRHG